MRKAIRIWKIWLPLVSNTGEGGVPVLELFFQEVARAFFGAKGLLCDALFGCSTKRSARGN